MDRRDFLAQSAGLAAAASLPACAEKQKVEARPGLVRLAVVGGNFGASFHFHLDSRCQVVAVSDLIRNRRAALAERYRCDTSYDSLEELLEHPDDFDAVAIFTPAPDHAAHVEACARLGKHVLSACPACMSLEEAQRMLDAVETAGVHYMNAETSWYLPQAIFAREAFQAGEFGRMSYIEAEYYHDRGDLQKLVDNKRSRFYAADGSGERSWRWGFPPMLYPTHSIAFLTGVTGAQVTSVSALGWGGDEHPYLTENVYDNPWWNMSALMECSDGSMLRCNVFWLVAADGVRASWFGDKQTFHMADPHRSGAVLVGRTKQPPPPAVQDYLRQRLPEPMQVRSGHGDSHAFISYEFISALLEDRPPEIDIYKSLQMAVPGIVAMESARRGGERLKVPVFARA